MALASKLAYKGSEGSGPYHIPGLNWRAKEGVDESQTHCTYVFSGRTRAVEFALGSEVAALNLDVLFGTNVLDERVCAAAASLSGTGKVDAVIGGPPRCIISILRERGSGEGPAGSDGGPRPVRGRTGSLRFGLPTNTKEEQSIPFWLHDFLLFTISLMRPILGEPCAL